VAIVHDPEIRAYAVRKQKKMLASCFKQRKTQINSQNVLANKKRRNVG